ncbi:DNA-binding protein OS=Streptomyces albaduncus OX=68172 GN=FHS32_003959 PE=4 SV=1 [Streptomyces griseoloalbus]
MRRGRRHGHLRVGAASAYVRCDDDELCSARSSPTSGPPGWGCPAAPTVLAAQADPAGLLEGLRAMGFAPAAESAEGDVLITRADARRTPPRSAPEPVPDGPPVPDDTLLAAAVRACSCAGDLAATAPRRPTAGDRAGNDGLPRTGAAETLATLQAAVLTGEALWIGYVNAEGAAQASA